MAYGCRYGPENYANAIGGANKFQYIVEKGGKKFRGNLHSNKMEAHKAARAAAPVEARDFASLLAPP
jgi:hypothetical protein